MQDRMRRVLVIWIFRGISNDRDPDLVESSFFNYPNSDLHENKCFIDVDLDFEVSKGECGDKEFVPCAGFFQCELPGWEFNEDLPSCDDSEVDCKDRGGDWGFFGGECCGRCSIPPPP